jgi:hypothetical protein
VNSVRHGHRPLAALLAILALAACGKKGDEPSTSGMALSKEPPPTVVPAPPRPAAPIVLPTEPGSPAPETTVPESRTVDAGALQPPVRPPTPEKSGPEPQKAEPSQ